MRRDQKLMKHGLGVREGGGEAVRCAHGGLQCRTFVSHRSAGRFPAEMARENGFAGRVSGLVTGGLQVAL